jgi:preprotein translocase subunit SecA
MRSFGTDKVKTMIQNMGYDDSNQLDQRCLLNQLKQLRKRLKVITMIFVNSLLDYDNIVAEQREIIYEKEMKF